MDANQLLIFLQYLLITMAGIFVIVNPLTTGFMFMSLLPDASKERQRVIAKRATVVATSIFFVFALLGSIIFKLFGISLEAFRIAGGIILFGIAMGMIRSGESEPERGEQFEEGVEELRQQRDKRPQVSRDPSVIPLAIPFISGPGSIATVMILTSEAPTIFHTGIVYVAVLLTTVSCYLAMIHSTRLVRFLGTTGKDIITKVFGLILAVVSVQFVINGVLQVMEAVD